MYLGGSPFDLPGLFSILPYGELAYGLWLPRGGVYGLVSGIERLALELGVVIHTSSAVRRILTDNGRVTGIELEDGVAAPAGIVVSNVDVPTTDASLVDCGAAIKARLSRRAAATRMTPSVMTFYWGVRGAIDGIGHHTIFLPHDVRATFDDLFKRRRVPRELAFYVSVPSATDASLAPAGCSAMFVLVPDAARQRSAGGGLAGAAERTSVAACSSVSAATVSKSPIVCSSKRSTRRTTGGAASVCMTAPPSARRTRCFSSGRGGRGTTAARSQVSTTRARARRRGPACRWSSSVAG